MTRFDIPSKVPLGATISLFDLSIATSLPELELARTMRYATTKGLFTESKQGFFGHSVASATLAKNKSLSDMTIWNAGFSTRLAVCIADALWAKHGLKRPDAPEAPFNEAYHGYVNLFDYMGKSIDRSREYYNYLDGRSQLPRYEISKVSKNWDWGGVGSGRVIDVSKRNLRSGCTVVVHAKLLTQKQIGGSSGYFAMEIARHLPQAKVVVQDINREGLKMGQEIVSRDDYLKSRVTFVEHDMFQPQDIEADVYFFRAVLHDWPDEECIKAIAALLPALKDGCRVLICEGVMPAQSIGRAASVENMHVLYVSSFSSHDHHAISCMPACRAN